MEKVKTLYLALGSNIGNRKQNILAAYAQIEEKIGPIHQKSDFYENEAEGFVSDKLFINTCIEVHTQLAPLQILEQIKSIEKLLGKNTDSKIHGYVSRIIDIDIILLEDTVYEDDHLSVPHLLFRKRAFVLHPLNSIASASVDPVTQLTVKQLFNLL